MMWSALAAACGRSAAPANAPSGPAGGGARLRPDAKVEVMTGISNDDVALFQAVVDNWQAAHPQGPHVEWGTPGGNIVQKLQALIASDTAPDVVAMNPSQAVGFADQQLLLPIDDYLQRDRYDLSDFFDLAVSQYRWKGKLYGLARGMSNQSLYINQTLFDQGGASYPPTKVDARGWDFNAFLQVAERLTKRSGSEVSQYGFVVGRGLRGGWGQWVWSNGAEIFDPHYTRCVLDDPRAIAALQFMQDLMYKYRVAPTPDEEQAAGGAEALFINQGKAAMQISPVAEVAQHRRASFKWDYAVNPVGKGRRVTTGGGVGWQVLKSTAVPEEAWAVFRHVTGAESAKQMATLWYPGRKSALTALLQQDPQLPPHNRQVGADGQNILHTDPIFPAWDDIQRNIITPALAPLWANKQPAQAVVGDLVQQVNTALAAAPAG